MSTVEEETAPTAEQAEDRGAPERTQALLDDLVAEGKASRAWAEAVGHLLSEGSVLADREDVRISDIVHRVMRAEATIDAAPPERLETIEAPDLRIRPAGDVLELPEPDESEAFERYLEIVRERRSTPMFGEAPMTLSELSAVLEASLRAKGMEFAYQRRDIPKRVFPTAGGLQPVDCYVIASRVRDLEPGIYIYDPIAHGLVLREAGDARTRLIDAALMTDWLFEAPAVLALVADLDRVLWKYGSRAYRYTQMDTGVITGQLYLAATALHLSVNAVAAFRDDALNDLLRLDGLRRFANLLVGLGPSPGRR